MLEGKVQNGEVYIGADKIMEVTGVADQEVFVGIRPEGFEMDGNGPLHCQLNNVEVMGRDVSVVSANSASLSGPIRSIINADHKVDLRSQTVSYRVKSHKCFLFDKETEKRIRYQLK